MCGISGFYLTKTQATLAALQALSAPMIHRGPDGSGYMTDGPIGFYHQRLAIHDLTANAKQPFTTSNGISAITNGEIYNYLTLKAQLTQNNLDIRWQSQSDCEVIPYLYDKYGFDFVEQLRGMYATAIYDKKNQTLVLSRDPFGMKQLYYYSDESGFYFASELRALTRHKNPNLDVIADVCELHFATKRETAITGIKRVLPGETLSIQQGMIVARGFYPTQKGFPYLKPQKIDQVAALNQFEKIFYESVDLHLKADVPIGLFLSGGIDSTCLLSMIKQIKTQPIHTYTIGFNSNNTHDERNLAATVAKYFDTNHHEIEFTEDDFWHYLPKAIAATDDPIADYAIAPTFKLAETAKKDVTVILSGEGGDEVFAGYGRYRHFIRPLWRKRRLFYMKGDLSRLGLLKHQANCFSDIKELKQSCLDDHYSRLYIAQTIDMHTWLPNDLLIKLDRCLMWHSLEGRTPFLDKEVITFANQLPNSLKLQGKYGKYLLRLWLQKQLPFYPAFEHKRGFSVPIQEWLECKREPIKKFLCEHTMIRKLCHIDKLNTVLSQPLNKNSNKACWSLLYIALWDDIHNKNPGLHRGHSSNKTNSGNIDFIFT